ncbi:hypothetical protein SUDANB58_00741 [Streptomyces sp. enrichment culture]
MCGAGTGLGGTAPRFGAALVPEQVTFAAHRTRSGGARVVTGTLAEVWGRRSVHAVLAVPSLGPAALVAHCRQGNAPTRPRGTGRVPVAGPTPVHPCSLLWHRDDPHPAPAALRARFAPAAAGHDTAGTGVPA